MKRLLFIGMAVMCFISLARADEYDARQERKKPTKEPMRDAYSSDVTTRALLSVGNSRSELTSGPDKRLQQQQEDERAFEKHQSENTETVLQ